jgi:methionyl-tRNA formyltransferase
MSSGSMLFLAKHKPFAGDSAQLLERHFEKTDVVFGELNDPFPEHLLSRHYDYVFSYVSPWIVPKGVLENTQMAAINLHPGPPNYPGIGCTNFAIYNGETEFGITVHHMEPKVDSGSIILVERFPILRTDSVYTLTQRCYAYIYIAFVKIVQALVSQQPLPVSEEHWTRKPYTRRELNDLCIVTPDMPEQEIARRVKATAYPGQPGAFVKLHGYDFAYVDKQ